MKIIDRYLLREMISPFFLSLFVFVLILLTDGIIRSIDIFVNNNVGFSLIIRFLITSLPYILQLTIPMSVLTGALIAFGRLSSDSEVVALSSSGISLTRMSLPIFGFSIVAWSLCQYITAIGIPYTAEYRQQIAYEILESNVNIGLKPHVFNDNFQNMVIYCDELHSRTNEMEKIFIYQRRENHKINYIFAQRGYKETYPEEKRVVLFLENGIIHEIGDGEEESFANTTFLRKILSIDIASSQNEESQKSDEEIPFSEIIENIKNFRTEIAIRTEEKVKKEEQILNIQKQNHSGKINSVKESSFKKQEGKRIKKIKEEIRNLDAILLTSSRILNKLTIVYHKKLAFPVACIVFLLAGIPLGIRYKTRGKSTGFSTSIALILFYYIIFIAGEGMGREGKFPPWLGIWFANFLLFVIGSYLFYKVATEKPFRLTQFILGTTKKSMVTILHSFKSRKAKNGDNPAVEKAHFYFNHSFPRILDVYVSREFTRIFVLLCVIIISITVIFEFISRIRSFLVHDAAFSDLIMYIFLRVPFFLILSIHVAVLISAILTINVFSRNNELTAMKANGISLLRAAIPILVIATIIAASVLFFNERIVPNTNSIAEDILNYKIRKKSRPSLFTHNKNWFRGSQNSIYSYSSYDQRENKNVLNDFLLYNLNDGFLPERKIIARQVIWDPQKKKWFYDQGIETYFDIKGVPIEKRAFKMLEAKLTEDTSVFRREIKDSDIMNYNELKNYISSLKKKGIDTAMYKTDLYAKISMPLISFVIALFGIPFAITFQRSGTLVGVGFSIFIGMIYFVAYRMGISLGHGGQFPPFLAAWGTNILFVLIGFYLILRAKT